MADTATTTSTPTYLKEGERISIDSTHTVAYLPGMGAVYDLSNRTQSLELAWELERSGWPVVVIGPDNESLEQAAADAAKDIGTPFPGFGAYLPATGEPLTITRGKDNNATISIPKDRAANVYNDTWDVVYDVDKGAEPPHQTGRMGVVLTAAGEDNAGAVALANPDDTQIVVDERLTQHGQPFSFSSEIPTTASSELDKTLNSTRYNAGNWQGWTDSDYTSVKTAAARTLPHTSLVFHRDAALGAASANSHNLEAALAGLETHDEDKQDTK